MISEHDAKRAFRSRAGHHRGDTNEAIGLRLSLAQLPRRDLNAMEKTEQADFSPDVQLRNSTQDPDLLHLLASAMEAADTAVAIIDLNRNIVWANSAVEPLTGFTPQELLGRSAIDFRSSREAPDFYDQLWHALSSGSRWRGEMVNQRKDGSFYHEERIIAPIRDAQGRVTHFIAVGLDITNRKRAELEASRLVQMADQTSNLLAMADLEGKLFFVNRTLCQTLGYAKEELLSVSFRNLISPNHPRELADEIANRMYQAGGWAGEARVRRKDGSDFAVDAIVQPLIDKKGEVTGCFGVARDNSERKRAEQELRQSHEMFEALFESSPDAMIAVDSEGRITRINFQCEGLFGYTRGELVGQPVLTVIPGYFRLAQPERNTDYRARILSDDVGLRGKRKDGSEFPVELGQSLLQTQAVNLVMVVVRDVTLRKQAEKSLRETHERLNIALRNAERQSREAAKLSELVDILQSCNSLQEAYDVTANALQSIVSFRAGAICVTSVSHTIVDMLASWGDPQATERTFRPEECWALRRSKVHQVRDKDAGSPLRCAHVHGKPEGGYLCVPLVAQGETFGMLYLESPTETSPERAPRERRSDSVDIEVRQATALGERLSLAFGNLRLREALRTQSTRDPLTNLFNRRYLEESLERELSRSSRTGQPVALLMLDIDHFKLFNDTFGHQGGDALLRTLGDFLSQRTRGQDVACRYGGEEFALVLSGANKTAANQRAEILRGDLKSLIVEHAGKIVGKVTFSIGIAVAPENGTSSTELIRAADSSLYRAKSEGRDRICVA